MVIADKDSIINLLVIMIKVFIITPSYAYYYLFSLLVIQSKKVDGILDAKYIINHQFKYTNKCAVCYIQPHH